VARHLITGGAGFIGSHLAEHLLDRGEQVTVFDNLSTGRFKNIAHLSGDAGFRCVVDDIRNERLTEELIRDSDYVHHLGASVGVRLVIERPTEALVNNVVSTEIVLRNASRYRRPVLIVSTSEVYGKSTQDVFREEDDRVMGSTDKSRWGYATSKALDEFLALAYHQETGLSVTIIRLFNIVGPRQTGRYGMVIPNFVRQALTEQDITVFGDGSQVRCFAHVKEIVPAIATLVTHRGAYGRAFNLGSPQPVTIRELAERVLAITGSRSRLRFIPYGEAYPPGFEDVSRRVPSIERLDRLIGFSPRLSLDEILADVIEDIKGQLGAGDLAHARVS
jgi:UDP-glucose 4-epimerase